MSWQRAILEFIEGGRGELIARLCVVSAMCASALVAVGCLLLPRHLGDWAGAATLLMANALAYALVLNPDYELAVIRQLPNAKLPPVKAVCLFICGLVCESNTWYAGLSFLSGLLYQVAAAVLLALVYLPLVEKSTAGGAAAGTGAWVDGNHLSRTGAALNTRDYVHLQEPARADEGLDPDV